MTKSSKIAITICSVLTTLAIVLATILSVSFNNETKNYKTQLNSVYQSDFYTLTDAVNNIETNLSKTLITQNSNNQEKYLIEICSLCKIAQNSLSSLPLNHQSLTNTYKFVNQLGGYCYVLNENILSLKGITKNDLAQLEKLHESSKQIKADLNDLATLINSGYYIVENISDPQIKTNNFSDEFNFMYDETIEYPSLIYDGPFSDSTEHKQVKGLSENKTSQTEAELKVKNCFKGYEINFVGESLGGDFDTYNFELKKGDITGYAQMTKRDNLVLQFATDEQSLSHNKNIYECEILAKNFLNKIGFNDITPVWSTEEGGFVYCNLTFKTKDVIVYPDMIKVKINQENGNVVGLEARSWAFNHIDRVDLSPQISSEQAKQKINQKLDVLDTNLCIIPAEYLGEKLAWEFKCVYNEAIYYDYIDAKTGEELKVLKVIQTDNGNLLMW